MSIVNVGIRSSTNNNLKVYTYLGRRDDLVPKDVTEVIIAPSVATIKSNAFFGCRSLERVTMPDRVTRIEDYAFGCCPSLRSIRFPPNLESIGVLAFVHCKSLEAVYLPPTVTHIGNCAFQNCKSLRLFYVPGAIEDIGNCVIYGCDRLLTTVIYNSDEVNQWLMQRYANLPYHQACSSISITFQAIDGCFQEHGIELATEVDDHQMTALHILCANPRVTGDAVNAYLTLASDTANAQDGTGRTGLHILCSLPYKETSTSDAIRAYLQLAPEAVNQQDSDGMTPFQHLCRSDVTFLDERNFSSLMIWWYHCMPPQT